MADEVMEAIMEISLLDPLMSNCGFSQRSCDCQRKELRDHRRLEKACTCQGDRLLFL